jgi:hypothetical protein
MAENLPGRGLWGWLGRQFGYVKKAVDADVQTPAKANEQPTVIYRKDHVQEAVVPEQPGVKLRRTVIDEVIVEKQEK